MEPRPDAETLLMPHVAANVPPVLPHMSWSRRLILLMTWSLFVCGGGHSTSAATPVSQWARRMDSSLLLAAQGKFKAAKRAVPADLYIDARQHTSAPFRGHTMDVTSYPYRPIMPSR